MIEDLLQDLTFGKVVIYLVGAWFVYFWIKAFLVAREIRSLGGRAPKVSFYLPFGFDFVYRAIKASKVNGDLQFWGGVLQECGTKDNPNPMTVEVNSGASMRTIFTADPENIKAVLTTQFNDYGKGESFHREWKEFLGDSIFATDGELWSRSRQLIRPMFVRERIVDTEMFEKHAVKLISLLGGNGNTTPKNHPGGSRVVDVSPLFFRYTMDAATDHLLGKGVGSLDNPTTRFAEAFRYVLDRQALIFRAGPFSRFVPRTVFRQELKAMNDFLQPFILHVLSLSDEELDKQLAKKDTFLDALARFTRDPQVLRDQLVAILLAGRDTTAATLSYCFFELSRNPEVVRKLRAEIVSHLSTNKATDSDQPNTSTRSTRKPTYIDLKEMKYLTAVINETMRIYPVVPFNVRHSLKPTTLPRGGGPDGRDPIGIRADTRIVYSTMYMQRRPDLYPPPPNPLSPTSEKQGSVPYFDPSKFIPERWLSSWSPKPWQFIPFNGGPRICIGQQFAMVEMGYTIVRILQEYERVVAADGGVEEPTLKFDVTLSPGMEFNCVFVKEGEEK
ncbi:hypothetical protein FQN54_007823 [Arachnomyces sp. PD_36]|nr:hypothetical protein FQN54_007823 [Arachnomyces sp. PD_36]